MWRKRDWQQFYILLGRGWERLRPPRPVRFDGRNVQPAEGFSFAELDDAGLSLAQAERFGLPVEGGRAISYGPNVAALREFARAVRAASL
jgi:ribosomal protein L13E